MRGEGIIAVFERINVLKIRAEDNGGLIRLAKDKTIVEKISIKESQFSDFIDISVALESECIWECGDIGKIKGYIAYVE
jgi:hypothetical protein